MSEKRFSAYSSTGLLAMLGAVRQALQVEDGLPKSAERLFGVRDYPDWRRWSTAIEEELSDRNVDHESIPW